MASLPPLQVQTFSSAPTALVILDGFGYSKNQEYNAVLGAPMIHFNGYFANYPHALLQASGTAVGLLPGMIGNSAVGHLTIGAGKIIKQSVTVLLESIADNSFFSNPVLTTKLKELAHSGKTLHIAGLLSDAGVHCHTDIIKACVTAAQNAGVQKIVLHPILDGRDAPPRSAEKYLQSLEEFTRVNKNVFVGTIQGRFFAMDRNNNWDRTNESYRMLVHPEFKTRAQSWRAALSSYYTQGITDEFIPPTHLDSDSTIMPGDGVIFCNIRADRARQLTKLLMRSPADFIITGRPYGKEFPSQTLYTPPVLYDTLLDKLSAAGKTIFTCAESEKYAHISYFFKGRKEELLPGETQVIINSHSPKTFIDNPEMCAPEITTAVLKSLRTNPCDFYLINYANPDMVGHSGNFNSTVKALQCIDAQLALLYNEIVEKQQGTLYITSDHGKAEQLWDQEHNQPCTAHTANPVPFVMIRKNLYHASFAQQLHTLADIAPLILKEMDLR